MADRPTGSQKAVETLTFLKARITRGDWPINTRIPRESELMAMIGVGKSTVREAVRALASQGMLEPIKGVGTFVRSRTPVTAVVTDFLAEYALGDVLVYRRALEMEAVRQAAVHRTAAQLSQLRAVYERDLTVTAGTPYVQELSETPGSFHHLVFEASGNRLLTGLFVAVMPLIRSAVRSGRLAHGADLGVFDEDHAGILAAIEAQDAVAAALAMAAHLDHDLVVVD
ncbi:FadR/GntR family transcriptional regulator [Microbacterium sp. CIAB417]|uniref:FadR/GntR family transcriptional regulator n=1 Tax=Microbacterium sp. CIAB417 TaxID=2860287 RepID=UPI001FAD3333|nr:FCD domain-containing protein [Microbacterium sp. CIAB417]